MSDYQVTRIGPLDDWREHFGGFDEARSRDGRRVVDHELTMQYIGMTANALVPGEQAGYWHTHARVEELYVFLDGRGQMGLDDDVVEVEAGTVVRELSQPRAYLGRHPGVNRPRHRPGHPARPRLHTIV